MMASAERHGLAEVAVTDHLDIDYPSWEKPFSNPDLNAYLGDIEAARAAFPRLRIRAGFEFGDTPGSRAQLRGIIESMPLDFVLLSCHVVFGVDPYDKGKDYFGLYPSKQQAYDAYLDALIDTAVAWSDYPYSSFAHIGYVVKCAPYPDEQRALVYDDHAERIDRLLRLIIEADAALEINTSGYRCVGEPIPSLAILRRFVELGGEMVTLGSDAHYPHHIALRFNTARSLALEAGLRWTATFDRKIRTVVPL